MVTYQGSHDEKVDDTIFALSPESLTNEEIPICDYVYCRCHTNGQCLSGNAISVRPSCGKLLTTGITIIDKDALCSQAYQENCK